MHHRPLRRAIAMSLGALLAFAGSAAADTMKADGDDLTTTIDVGAVAPGAVLTVNVNFILTCASSTHVDPGQTVTASIDSAVAPEGGAVLLVTDGTVPAPADWPAEGAPCAVPAQTSSTGTPSVVTLQAPTKTGLDYGYSLMYHRSILPFGVNDDFAVRTSTAVDIVLDVVVDTTAPTFTNLPGNQTVPTADPTGTTLVYPPPGAVDIVDPHPVVACLPASGTHIGLGTTTVNCTATDASGNTAHGSFEYTVVYVAPHTASAIWGEPVSGNGTTFVANRGRNIPIKVELFLDGVALTSGAPEVIVSPCATGSGVRLALIHGNGRWNVGLDTSVLDGSCYTVTATIDGLEAGSFRLELRGVQPAKANSHATTVSQPTATATGPTKTKKTKP